MNVLVFGGTVFLGQHVVDAAAAAVRAGRRWDAVIN
jgi:uncharacterized protein YbjT (DUF2867 family)